MVRPRAETLILDIEKSDLLSRSVYQMFVIASTVRYANKSSNEELIRFSKNISKNFLSSYHVNWTSL